jgi:hypothetical protein
LKLLPCLLLVLSENKSIAWCFDLRELSLSLFVLFFFFFFFFFLCLSLTLPPVAIAPYAGSKLYFISSIVSSPRGYHPHVVLLLIFHSHGLARLPTRATLLSINIYALVHNGTKIPFLS